jgi:hypothetical protein
VFKILTLLSAPFSGLALVSVLGAGRILNKWGALPRAGRLTYVDFSSQRLPNYLGVNLP